MANENMTLMEENINFDELEELQDKLEEEISDLDFLEKEKMGNPENLGNIIKDVVWEQFINQIAVTAGEDFITENNGLTLDLSDEAHIQTTENFKKGKIATHNTKINYQERYDNYINNFQRDDNGNIKMKKDKYTKEDKEVLRVLNKKKDPNGENYNTNYNAREFIDKGRPIGSKTINKEHLVPAAEIIRDTEANAHLSREEQRSFANSKENLIDLDSSANQSKGDSKMTDWLERERKGKKPSERFSINEEDLRKADEKSREKYKKIKEEGKKRSIETGKKSQQEEVFRIGGKALRAAIMSLLAELVKEIIKKLVKWFKSGKRELSTLKESFKEAVNSFIGKIKQHLINAGNTISTTIMTAIIGPIFATFKKIWMVLKQAGKSIKEAISYIKKPENRKKSLSLLMLEVSKIILAGLTGISAIVLSEIIEKGLMAIPIFAIEIPLIGSLANVLGIFFGAVVSGIVGAIVINFITKMVSKKHDSEITEKQIDKKNKILLLQEEVINLKEEELKIQKEKKGMEIKKRHEEANEYIKQVLNKFSEEEKSIKEDDFDEIDYSDNQDDFNEIDKMLKDFKF